MKRFSISVYGRQDLTQVSLNSLKCVARQPSDKEVNHVRR